VYETTNGGTSWTRTSFPGGAGTGRISLTVADVGVSSTLYASVQDPSPTNFGATLEIEKSTDAGGTWNAVMTKSSANYINYMGRQGWYDQTLIIDPNDPTGNTVYAEGQPSVIKTSDGGTAWTDISVGTDGNGPHVDHHGIGFDHNLVCQPMSYFGTESRTSFLPSGSTRQNSKLFPLRCMCGLREKSMLS
jgi:hypothetical protein